jgi:hypothetical protein
VRVWLDLREEEEVCWPFKGKHSLKIFVVENIDPLQVTIHSYTNLFYGNHSITFISMVHSLETAKFETVPFKIQIFQKLPTATFTTSSP